MVGTPASSERAIAALALVERVQGALVAQLERVAEQAGAAQAFAPVSWERDAGRHGGGVRFTTGDTAVFNRASVNVSQVHYDDLPDRALASATALSTIVHPDPPRAPSMHMHLSWTEMRDGSGYWRAMADLNPSIEDPSATAAFSQTLRDASGDLYEAAAAQGDRYFAIPALGRHRGVSHFYLEGWNRGSWDQDAAFVEGFGRAVIGCYAELLAGGIAATGADPAADRAKQLAYHTLYLFQVLTLDRGTTSGLLVHDQNDVGILGSLPARVDRALLASWEARVPALQRPLVRGLVQALPEAVPSPVTVEAKRALAQVVRAHYRSHPEALALQASGDVVPPTVANHRRA